MSVLFKRKILVFMMILSFLLTNSKIIYAFNKVLSYTHYNRLMIARKYIKISTVDDMLKDVVVEMSKNIPEKLAKEYFVLVMKKIKVDVLEGAMLKALANNFTVDELTALKDFNSSKEGKSVMKKMGKYSADIMPVLQQEMQRANIEALMELKEKNTKK